jgi:hemerythrin-like domain-containing protein
MAAYQGVPSKYTQFVQEDGMSWPRPPSKLKVLKELIDHHVQEEESNLFKVAQKVISSEQAKEIGQKYQQEKDKQLGKSR